jgi:hypothetical protein
VTARAALLWSFRQVLRIYFRKVHVAGDVPSAAVRGRLFAPNHVNGLIDPLLVLTTAECVVSPLGKAPLWKIPVLGWLLDAVGAVPIVRRRDDPTKAAGANDAIFDKVGGHLRGGGNVLVFPEGTSHNEPHLVKIRSGPSRMLLRARASGAHDVTFQAVGLEFEARDAFRSRVLVLYGPVRALDAIVRADGNVSASANANASASDNASANGNASATEERAVAAVSHAIESDLASLVVSGETWDERRLVARVADLLIGLEGGDRASLLRWSELARIVRDSGRALARESPGAIDPVREEVTAYFDALERSGLRDADLRAGDHRPLRAGRIGAVAMLLALPLALVGAMLYALPYRVPRLVAARTRDADVISTFKLATGIVVFPLWAAIAVALAIVLLPSPLGALGAVLVFATPLPALWWLDALEDGRFGARKTPEALRVLRESAVRAIEKARDEHLARRSAPSAAGGLADAAAVENEKDWA